MPWPWNEPPPPLPSSYPLTPHAPTLPAHVHTAVAAAAHAAQQEMALQTQHEAIVALLMNRCREMYDGEEPMTLDRIVHTATTSPSSLCALGWTKGYGLFGQDQDWAAAIACYKQAADLQHAHAYSLLASVHIGGMGVPVNLAEADRMRMRAAELGDAREMHNLGHAFASGQRCQHSWARAVEWYGKAIAAGYVSSMVNLGMLYEKGEGVEQSWPEAFRLYVPV
jgi:TPR repeat protein